MGKILVLHGPNLNLLGERETDFYGKVTLEGINQSLTRLAEDDGVGIVCLQSNSEGEIIDILHKEGKEADCIIFNPAAYTHYSLAIRDAVKAIKTPVIEVHLSNIYAREDFRQHSVIAPVAIGQISGFGHASYQMAFFVAMNIVRTKKKNT